MRRNGGGGQDGGGRGGEGELEKEEYRVAAGLTLSKVRGISGVLQVGVQEELEAKYVL